MEHTIAALATPPGIGGIAVIRISGARAYDIADSIFKPKNNKKETKQAAGYTAMLGDFLYEGKACDEVIALCFRAPHSYTGEDVVELSCHGGSAVSELLLRACYEAGAVPADAGEFTKRALLNGRISLTQAEAVMDLIHATSRQGARAAAANLEGALAARIRAVRERLITLAGHLAAYTDYPEEDVPELSQQAFAESLRASLSPLEELLRGYDAGAVLRRGVRTVIIGSPNVGKSTLLNLLAGFEKAIVTPVAGTTRDVVEQEISLGGVRLLLADTAGLRETGDEIEAEGIRRSYAQLEKAGLALAVFDASRELASEDRELAEKCAGRAAIAIINKTDLQRKLDDACLAPYFQKIVYISATDPAFLPEVEKAVLEVLGVAQLDPDAALLANERQYVAAKTARDALQDALTAIEGGYTLDAAGVCVDDALRALYALTGENASDQVIDEVFSTFCVGK